MGSFGIENLAMFLSVMPDFAKLSSEERDSLAAAMEIQRCEDGHAFITEGERADGTRIFTAGGQEHLSLRSAMILNRRSPAVKIPAQLRKHGKTLTAFQLDAPIQHPQV